MRCLIFLLAVAATTAYKTYEGYQLIEVTPEHESQLKFLHSLTNGGQGIDFWEAPSHLSNTVRMLLSPDQMTKYRPQFSYSRLAITVLEQDYSRVVMAEKLALDARRQKDVKAFDINDFNTLDDINSWLQGEALTKCTAAGLTCTVSSIGQSFEFRETLMITITTPGADKPGIYIDAMTHSREWLTAATTLFLMDNMFNTYGSDAEVTRLLDTYNWHFVHIVNPDGYDYTWTSERLYRKNRNDNYCPGGNMGVDLNRNYDFKHGTNGVSHQECDDTYCGPNGNSEPEIQNVANWLQANGANYLYTMITIHAYGNYMLHPWGTTTGWDQPNPDSYPCDLADDHTDLNAVSSAGCDAIEATYGTSWSCGNSCARIYTTSGATDDYSKGVCGIKYAYNPELRGNSFIVNPSEIAISFEEFWNGVVAMIGAIELNPPAPVAEPKH